MQHCRPEFDVADNPEFLTLLPTTPSTPVHPETSPAPLLSFLDRGAPYRGRWLIYTAADSGAYDACQEVGERSNLTRVVDQRRLNSMIEARRFTSHLILHGWSPDLVQVDHGYRLLGLGR